MPLKAAFLLLLLHTMAKVLDICLHDDYCMGSLPAWRASCDPAQLAGILGAHLVQANALSFGPAGSSCPVNASVSLSSRETMKMTPPPP